MPVFQYSSRHMSGVPVYGIEEAVDEGQLRVLLQSRGLQLTTAVSLDLHTSVTLRHQPLPRLLQLRVGERLREAMLTDLPVHLAVRAIAEEPFEHPVLILHSWLLLLSGLLTGVLGIGLFYGVVPVLWFLGGAGVSAALLLLRLALYRVLILRPRSVLLRYAQRLESGDSDAAQLGELVPWEMRQLSKLQLSESVRARSYAELLWVANQSALHSIRVAVQSTGPLLLGGFALCGVAVFLGTVNVVAAEILRGFGIALPWVSEVLISAGLWIHGPGLWTVVLGLSTYFAVVLLLGFLILTGKAPSLLHRLPFLGTSLKWLSQGKFCNLLSIPLRHNAGPADALRIAVAGCPRGDLQSAGEQLATQIESGSRHLSVPVAFDGLPVSVLQQQGDSVGEQQSASAAEVFAGLGQVLENAATGHGAIFVVITEIAVVVFTAGFALLAYLALVMPLVKLLVGLSVNLPLFSLFAGG